MLLSLKLLFSDALLQLLQYTVQLSLTVNPGVTTELNNNTSGSIKSPIISPIIDLTVPKLHKHPPELSLGNYSNRHVLFHSQFPGLMMYRQQNLPSTQAS
jgi:hypothetical protein